MHIEAYGSQALENPEIHLEHVFKQLKLETSCRFFFLYSTSLIWREKTNKLPQQKTYEQLNTLPNTNIFTPRLWMLGRLYSFPFWDGLPGKSPLFHLPRWFFVCFFDPGHFPMSAAFRTCRAFPAWKAEAATAVSGQVGIQTKNGGENIGTSGGASSPELSKHVPFQRLICLWRFFRLRENYRDLFWKFSSILKGSNLKFLLQF